MTLVRCNYLPGCHLRFFRSCVGRGWLVVSCRFPSWVRHQSVVVLRDVSLAGLVVASVVSVVFVSVVRETGDLLSVVFGRRVVEVGTLCRAGTSLAGVRDGDLVRGGRVLVADSVLAAVRVREDRASVVGVDSRVAVVVSAGGLEVGLAAAVRVVGVSVGGLAEVQRVAD